MRETRFPKKNRHVIRLRACAKINLDLRIIGKRQDGYHELCTLMHTIELQDDLEMKLLDRAEIQLRCTGFRGVPEGRDNLAYRAADAMLAAFAPEAGIAIHLHKRIPMGSGLGGGSSDCACVIRGLAKLLALRIDHDQLVRIAGRLGSATVLLLHSPCQRSGSRESDWSRDHSPP